MTERDGSCGSFAAACKITNYTPDGNNAEGLNTEGIKFLNKNKKKT